MKKSLLDTDIFSEVLKGRDPNVVRSAKQYRAEFSRFTVSTITVVEVTKGFHKLRREDRLKGFLAALEGEELLTLDVASAEVAGRIYADLERTGQPIGRADPMIAGIAIRYGIAIITGNTDHYERIRALGYPLELGNWRV